MVDDIQPDAAHDLVCTWCSAPLASADLERCPSCGANLVGDLAEPLPGVTAVDAAAIIRGTPTATRPRNRLLSWISGDYPDDAQTATDAQALAPPDPAVRREMLRLELEGEVANLKAEADALVAEAAAEGRVVEPPDISALTDDGVAAAEAAVTGEDGAFETMAAPASPEAGDDVAEPEVAEAADAEPAPDPDAETAPPA
jgi:hypothetical protein